ncbi:predicted protein [Naegleria gruberi]|uniref:Predicted protein n=1 Tax=Naegleria gruberi TaxID=5762 RepID=D2VME4_NAEGR|nr:uncharacterized protein NAEGRDRAFT_70104 [Naegleria gruberi]EFC41974.1 predicted protein [Naegleria gruberi]|eukprot:XP_002674718.1 predicted protein [Naegleria gruberi strain NEG-M]
MSTPTDRQTAVTTPPNQAPKKRQTQLSAGSSGSADHANIDQLLTKGSIGEDLTNIWSERDLHGHSVLHVASFVGVNNELFDRILQSVKDQSTLKEICNLKSSDEKTALSIACERGHLEIVKKLYDLTDSSNDLYSPIHIAAMNGHTNVVEYLVREKNVDVNSLMNIYGFTPLHLAAQYGRVEMVYYLIDELGAKKDIACTTEGMLPIHTAILNNNVEVLKALVHIHSKEHEVSTVKYYERLSNDHIHINPLLLAIANSHSEEEGVTPETLKASAEMVKFLVNELDADYSLSGNNGISALHMASEVGNCDLINFFVTEKKEKVDQVCDITEDTPLYLAVINCHLDAVKLLVSLGADINAKNRRGNSPLSIAQELSSKHEKFQNINQFLSSQ